MSFFDVLNNLTGSTEYTYTPELEADITPFMINRGMSNFYDCIMHANEMNIRQGVSKKMLYDYYHFAIHPKRKRFAKWAKANSDADLMLICKYYGCNQVVGEQYLAIIKPEDLEIIREKMSLGGRQ